MSKKVLVAGTGVDVLDTCMDL